MKSLGSLAILLVLSAVVLAGCATTVDYSAAGSEYTFFKSANSGGAYSVSGWEFAEGKLQYKTREYGGRGERRR